MDSYIVAYDIPKGCIGAYFPEANALIPLAHHDKQAHTPAYKATPVRLSRSAEPIFAEVRDGPKRTIK